MMILGLAMPSQPPAGSTRSSRAKSQVTMGASTKVGVEMPRTVTPTVSRSSQVLALRAASTPSGTPRQTAMTSDTRPSCTETQMRSRMSGPMGWPRYLNDSPKSPCSALTTYSAYCSGEGAVQPALLADAGDGLGVGVLAHEHLHRVAGTVQAQGEGHQSTRPGAAGAARAAAGRCSGS